jgi:hypothetical protein
MSKLKGLLLLGLGFACGAMAPWGYQKVQTLGSAEPKKVVESFIQDQSYGHYNKAMQWVTGEALVRLDHPVGKLTPDPVSKVTFNVKAQGRDYSEIEANIQTQKDTLKEVFYLTKQNSDWKIFSIQEAQPNWSSLKTFALTEDQKKPITTYTSLLANGNAKDALDWLVGPARMRAATIPMNLPKQTITMDSLQGIGKTDNGVLVEAVETINNSISSHHKEKLLYTLVPVGSTWKIYDIRLVQ